MARGEKLYQIRKEIKEGDLNKARERLLGLHSSYPADLEVLQLLGDIFYVQGNLVKAGRFWSQLETKTPDMQEAVNEYDKHLSRTRRTRVGGITNGIQSWAIGCVCLMLISCLVVGFVTITRFVCALVSR